MKEIKNLGNQRGLFECPYCEKEIEKNLYNGRKQASCGSKECTPSRSHRHGYVGTQIYNTWANMMNRCEYVGSKDYQYYGAKGITICDKWKTFKGFLEDMENSYKEGLTIDRIDPDKGYYKENCQWLSKSDNCSKDKLKEVVQIDEEGNELARYSSAKKAAEATGLHYQSLARVARGERNHTQNTYWKYTNA